VRDILEVAELLGLDVEPAGSEYRCRCTHPGHIDQQASLYLNPGNQMWFCFGDSRGGGVLGLVRWIKPEWTREQVVECACGEEGEAGLILHTLRTCSLFREAGEDGAELFIALMRSHRGKEPPQAPVDALYLPDPLTGLQELVRV
jgi:hypothetical protein